jgi:rod shape-determining protein MreD
MRTFMVLAVAAVVAMLLQTTVLPSVPGLPVVPDLLLVLAVYLGVRHPGIAGAAGAFVLGYFVDTFSGIVLGLHAFTFTAVYAVSHIVARQLWVEGGASLMTMVFLGTWGARLLGWALANLVAAEPPLWQHVLGYGLLEAVVAALIAPAVFAGVTWEKRLVGV